MFVQNGNGPEFAGSATPHAEDAGMKTFNTADVVYADRTDYWRHAISQTFVPLESTYAGSERNGILQAGVWGDLRLSEVSCSAQEVIRGRKGADNNPDNMILLSFVSQGKTSVVQGGNHASLSQGEFALYDTRFPYELHLDGETRQHVVQISKDHLSQRVGKTEHLVANAFGKQHPLMPFLQMLLNNLMTLPEDISLKYAAMLHEQFLELLSSVIADECSNRSQAKTYHGLLFQMKIMINQRLADPALTAATIADAFGISSRYLNMLLKKDGTSFGRYVLNQRLTKAADALHSPLHRATPISQIAWRSGFSDMPHFSREFRARFGCSATEYRQQSSEPVQTVQKY